MSELENLTKTLVNLIGPLQDMISQLNSKPNTLEP